MHEPGTGAGAVLRTSALGKRFAVVAALDAVDLRVAPGEVVGLLGPNRAGKTTLLRCAVGHLHPSAGTLAVLGGDPRDARVRARLGHLPAEARLEPRMRVEVLAGSWVPHGLVGSLALADRFRWALPRTWALDGDPLRAGASTAGWLESLLLPVTVSVLLVAAGAEVFARRDLH